MRTHAILLCALLIILIRIAPVAAGEAGAFPVSSATIVLPPRLMAGHTATLAVLGADGKLAAGVKVELSDGQSVTTDRTGRASFRAPSAGDYLLAKTSGASAAALIDPAVSASEPKTSALPPVVSIHDRFSICAAGLEGQADADAVRISGEFALVVAASPICLVAVPGPNARPGPASLSVEAPGVQRSAETTLISLEFEPPKPPLKPGETGQFVVRAQGTAQKLGIGVENRSPSVLRFARGDSQKLVTSGGAQNVAVASVQAISSGDFSFSARLLPTPDAFSAVRYLRAAELLAPKELRRELSGVAGGLARHPRDVGKARTRLEGIPEDGVSDDCQILLNAARGAL